MESLSKLAKGTRSPMADIPHVRSTDENYLNEQYEFGEKLGEGSFGVVWVVKHRETGECFACKIINKEKVSSH
jgi:serine/threonine kinase 33